MSQGGTYVHTLLYSMGIFRPYAYLRTPLTVNDELLCPKHERDWSAQHEAYRDTMSVSRYRSQPLFWKQEESSTH